MIKKIIVCFCILIGLTAKAENSALNQVEFWQSIVMNHYAVPKNYRAEDLAKVLQQHLGNSDPIWRDEFAYSITASWIQSGLLKESALTQLMPEWIKAAENQQASNQLARSFGILHLGLVASFDQQQAFLKKDQVDRLWKIAIDGIKQPKDWRGWDEREGWVHITAHSADLIKFLAMRHDLDMQQQINFLNAIELSITKAPCVFVYAEMERLSETVLQLQQRKDYPVKEWSNLVKRLSSLDEGFVGINPKNPQYVVKRNANQFLAFVIFQQQQRQ